MCELKFYLLKLLMNRKKATAFRNIIFILFLAIDFGIVASLRNTGISTLSVILIILFTIFGMAVNIYEALYNREIEILKKNSLKNIVLAEPSIHEMYMISIYTLVVLWMYYRNSANGIDLSILCFILLILLYIFSIFISRKISEYYEEKINK